ncbi:glycosyl transferase family 8 [Actinoplanes cyaneus]|uniref:Glycosyl transferase family 8 n=1 Tax=Actinoplanes cyaneus TaxID=52696 RepID=A0A919ISQ5_9ACTN|nr:glycosyltransferase family 8 protein [Actinoplanes cyaneus]MCW2144041.1 Lipopolysaccharide biosynthesis protein, LPS:glycosyltransferase [Actinoplanes cyaneus]GID70743.1 glycosyl transferase family 8 [Actinoplanes cyaneus]
MTDLHVMFAIDDRYAGGAAVVAHSIRQGLRDRGTPVVFHVVDCDLSPDRRAEVQERLGRAGDVEFYQIPDRLSLRIPSMWLSDAALARLHISSVIPASVPRVLYLDADVLVLEDLTELYGQDLRGSALGAVLNGFAPDRSLQITAEGARQVQTGAVPPGHFNSGVLLIDMNRWRDEGITERAVEMHRKYGSDTTHFDQDILNHIFAGRWTPMAEKWNKLIEHPVHGKFGAGRLDQLTRREGIIHYIGAVKPWHDEFPDNALRRLYREYASVPA